MRKKVFCNPQVRDVRVSQVRNGKVKGSKVRNANASKSRHVLACTLGTLLTLLLRYVLYLRLLPFFLPVSKSTYSKYTCMSTPTLPYILHTYDIYNYVFIYTLNYVTLKQIKYV